MEEDDEFVPEPDIKGTLNLSNRAWINLDPSVWDMALKILKLDISYNHFAEIPAQIGEMIMLRELIASFNKITRVPVELGKLKRLRRLILNNNRLKSLPLEIGLLDNLEEIIVSENSLEEIPMTIAKMSNLKILKLSNNKLRSIPYELADILTLEECEVANNPHLDSVPAKWRGDTESVLFTCRVHRGNIFCTDACRLSHHNLYQNPLNLNCRLQRSHGRNGGI